VHDSIVVDVHPDEVQDVGELVVDTMEDVSMYPWAVIPFDVEIKIERSWDASAKRRKKR
jgi:DNA polymerase I-like protein with 3'-5' exonuclease and polymerase domains